MKTIALMFFVVYNGVMAQHLPCFKQDIYRALDTVGIPNIASPHQKEISIEYGCNNSSKFR